MQVTLEQVRRAFDQRALGVCPCRMCKTLSLEDVDGILRTLEGALATRLQEATDGR